MAIQVRLDLTPQEFDLLRDALDTHKRLSIDVGNDDAATPQARREARAAAMLTDDLLKKVR